MPPGSDEQPWSPAVREARRVESFLHHPNRTMPRHGAGATLDETGCPVRSAATRGGSVTMAETGVRDMLKPGARRSGGPLLKSSLSAGDGRRAAGDAASLRRPVG